MYYHSTEAVDIPMEEDDSPWLDSSITTTTSSGLLTNNDSISTLEWNKLSSKYIDVNLPSSPPPISPLLLTNERMNEYYGRRDIEKV
jgi:hypothetical protein